MKRFITGDEDARKRADVYLAEKYPQFARAALAKLFPADKVRINHKVEKAGYKLKIGDTVEVEDSWLVEREFDPIELPIIYEDSNVMVIDKPAGVLSHARGGLSTEASVASFLRNHIDPHTSGAERAGIVHRLDRATSGVMICAKNQSTQSFLQKQFHDRTAQKTYLAIVSPTPIHRSARIDAPISRDQKHQKRFCIDRHGKEAVTDYVLLSKNGIKNYALLECRPKTGRTHQLRVHLLYIQSPIVGDDLYHGEQAERLLLHAATLTLNIPGIGEKTFSSPRPAIFDTYVK